MKKIVTVNGTGNFAWGGLCPMLWDNTNDETTIVFYARESEKWNKLIKKKRTKLEIRSPNGEIKRIPISIAKDKESFERLLIDQKVKIILFITNDTETKKFLYNSSHSVITCVGPGLRDIVKIIEELVSDKVYIYTAENDYATALELSRNACGNIKIYTSVVDCICTDFMIEEDRIMVTAEDKRKITYLDLDRRLSEIFKYKKNEQLDIVHSQQEMDRKYEQKFYKINLPHRILCYAIICKMKGNVEYLSANKMTDAEISMFLKDKDIVDYVLNINEAISQALFYVFDVDHIAEFINLPPNGELYNRYMELDYIEHNSNLERMRKQHSDKIGRVIKSDSESVYKARLIDTIHHLENAARILTNMMNDKQFTEQFEITDEYKNIETDNICFEYGFMIYPSARSNQLTVLFLYPLRDYPNVKPILQKTTPN